MRIGAFTTMRMRFGNLLGLIYSFVMLYFASNAKASMQLIILVLSSIRQLGELKIRQELLPLTGANSASAGGIFSRSRPGGIRMPQFG